MDLEREVDRIYLQHYVPAGVVVNQELEVLQFRGQTGLFLEHRPGQATLNLLQMVKPQLAAEVKNAILTVRHTGLPFGKTGLQTHLKGTLFHFSLDVFPLVTGDSQNFLVVFNESELLVSSPSEKVATATDHPPETPGSTATTKEPASGENLSEKIALPATDESASYRNTITQDQDHRLKWLRTFSESLPTMICYTRADNTTLFFNTAWLAYTGRPEAREANGGWMMGIHPGDQPDFLHFYNHKIEKGEPFQTELRLLRFDGEYCVVSLHAVPVLNAVNSFEGYMISYSEIAGRNVLPLATDWNLPQQSPDLPERASPVTAEPLETYVKTDLNSVLKKVVKEFERLVLEKKANVQFDQLPIVHAMPKQMEQLFYHLISNALKFTHKGRTPEIWITARKLSGEKLKKYQEPTSSLLYYEFIVQDNGIGLPGKHEFPGTGIGLTLCRKIVLNHKGDIYAESKENEGTRVHIILPARQDATSSFQA